MTCQLYYFKGDIVAKLKLTKIKHGVKLTKVKFRGLIWDLCPIMWGNEQIQVKYWTYSNAFEVDNSLIGVFVVEENGVR